MIDVGSASMRLWLRRVAALLAVIVGGWIVGALALQASSMAMVHRGAPAVPGGRAFRARGIANSNFISQMGEEAAFQRSEGVASGLIGLRQGYNLQAHLWPMSPTRVSPATTRPPIPTSTQ
jgi:hypothetical protein